MIGVMTVTRAMYVDENNAKNRELVVESCGVLSKAKRVYTKFKNIMEVKKSDRKLLQLKKRKQQIEDMLKEYPNEMQKMENKLEYLKTKYNNIITVANNPNHPDWLKANVLKRKIDECKGEIRDLIRYYNMTKHEESIISYKIIDICNRKNGLVHN